MFGYVRADRSRLSDEAWARYQGAYCGLCHCLKARYGFKARFILQYDFVFLCLLLEASEDVRPTCQRRCAAHPVKPRPCLEASPTMELCADESVILAYDKLLDGVADEGFFQGLGCRLGAFFLKGAYQKARAAQPGFDAHAKACLAQLDELEREGSAQLDRCADAFARLLSGAAGETGKAQLDRPRGQLLYHLGRWIYLIDALDDLDEDIKRGRYNPVAARFGNDVDRDYLTTTMSHSLALCQSAFQLLPRNGWSDILENILYAGLPGVQALVLAGKWRKKKQEITP